MLSSVHNTLPPRFQCKEIFTLPIKLVRTASVKISVCVFSDVLAFVHPMPGKKNKKTLMCHLSLIKGDENELTDKHSRFPAPHKRKALPPLLWNHCGVHE